ncbi:MAG TPA: iron-containing alcohol dehydrogenase, partial [bacterium]|nr:iron-containing alcohol dehydrogenase [bacterium]
GLPARLRLGPGLWLAGEGAWEAAAVELASWPRPIGLLGEAGLLKLFRKPLGAAFLESGLHVELLAQPDGCDCDAAALEALLAQAKPRNVRSLLAFGGGRMLDLGKLAAQRAGWRLATLPSSVATCAAASAVAVKNLGGAYDCVLDLGAPAELCVVEGPVLRGAPPRLLAAGLADTLAKWLEWRAVEGAPGFFGAGAGWALARQAAETCERAGAEALRGGTAALDACIEACLLQSAAASCAGEAPAAAAHSLANALSRQPSGQVLLHGEAVGLGLLWQEALLKSVERENMEPGRLKALLTTWGLPVALPPGLDLDRLCVDATAAEESVHLLGLGLDRGAARRHLPVDA